MEKVSIIVPVYNVEKYLKSCLRSILRQSYPAIEVILVNDGSNDNSLAICKEFAAKDDRIRVIDIPNGGVSNARNIGIAAATGKYVQFVDSDDKIRCDMVQTLVDELENADADMAFCALEIVFVKRGRVVRRRNCIRKTLPHHYTLEREEFLNRLPELFRYVGGMEGPCNKMYRRSMIVENGLSFPLDTSFGEDHLFNVQCYAHCRRVVFTPEILYYYMQYGQPSLSRRCPPNLCENQLRLVNALRDMLAEQVGIGEHMLEDLKWYHSVSLCGVLSQICAEENGLTREQQVRQLQALLDDEEYMQAYYAKTPEYEFPEEVEPYIRARDAQGAIEAFDAVRAQLRADGRRPVSMFLARHFRTYSEKHPDTRMGKAAHILYLNLATDGVGTTLKRVLHKAVK